MSYRSRRGILSSRSFVVAILAVFILASILSPVLAGWTVASVLGREGDVHSWLALTAAYTLFFVALGGLCSYRLAATVRERS
ncbi:hypothetical protein [Natronorubrum texcoconense]|uniref:Uncharacterized protein n=1 Tax=Natronorubrum texcoconense TaxID=1095776 RepID=A0A1G8XZE1_9EURY|nr:hypothetical protein [Natronorubrum texcoconense]SDJ95265.1 hypothetical protein SAMN04515672_1941 [Natronorubrum texcoconense]